MDSEFRKCQKFISEHAHLSATESAHLVKVYTDDDPDFKYGLTFKGSSNICMNLNVTGQQASGSSHLRYIKSTG